MGKRRAAELMDGGTRRDALLLGIRSRAAIQLYDEGMAALTDRGEDGFASAMILRDAVQWTEAIDRMQEELMGEVKRGDEADGKRMTAIMRAKREAEDARRRALQSLMLVPRTPRGRPPKAAAQEPTEEPEDDGWDAFGSGGDEP